MKTLFEIKCFDPGNNPLGIPRIYTAGYLVFDKGDRSLDCDPNCRCELASYGWDILLGLTLAEVEAKLKEGNASLERQSTLDELKVK